MNVTVEGETENGLSNADNTPGEQSVEELNQKATTWDQDAIDREGKDDRGESEVGND